MGKGRQRQQPHQYCQSSSSSRNDFLLMLLLACFVLVYQNNRVPCCWAQSGSFPGEGTEESMVGGRGGIAGGRGGRNGAGGIPGPIGGGQDGVFGQRPIGGLTEKTEGCFDRFDSEFAVELGRANINNKRCQAICTDQGFAMAATGLNDSCFCGNDYPSAFHRVDTGLCDLPCNPDKASCFSFTCCGSRDNNFFTVSWSGEMDIMKQLLRQLSHDYRFNSPTFVRQIEGDGFCDRVSLRLDSSPLRREGGPKKKHEDKREERRQPWMEPGAPPMYLSIGDGCPVGWALFDCWCYRTHWAESSTYDQACVACQAEGAELVTVTSEAENCFLRQMQGGCQGWIGIKGFPQPEQQQAPQHMASNPSMLGGSDNIIPNPLTAAPTTLLQNLAGAATSKLSGNLSLGLANASASFPAISPNATTAQSPTLYQGMAKVTSTILNRLGLPPAPAPLEGGGKRGLLLNHHYYRRFVWEPSTFKRWASRNSTHDTDQHSELIPTAFIGQGEGRRFDDVASTSDIVRIKRIALSYDDLGLESIQLIYQKADREEVEGRRHGRVSPLANAISKTVVVDLEGEGEELVGLRAVVGLARLKSLALITREKDGRQIMHGPYGSLTEELDWRTGEIRTEHPIIGLFGHEDTSGHLRSLGLYQRLVKGCGWIDATGNWSAVSCFHAFPNETAITHFICETKGWINGLSSCQEGWASYGESCYVRQWSQNLTWWDARNHCQELGGHLVSIASHPENDFVKTMLADKGGYIGFHRSPRENAPWVWDMYWNGVEALPPDELKTKKEIQGTSLSSMFSSEDSKDGEVCYEMQEDGEWVAISCYERKPRIIICEMGAADSSCQCPFPTTPGEEEKGFWHSYGCSCYLQKVTGGGGGGPEVSWIEAQSMCGQLGGRLVWIESKGENAWLLGLLKLSLTFNKGFLPAYIGLNNILDHHKYVWTYYENWKAHHAQQVNPWTQYQDNYCAQMTRDGPWIKASCEGQRANCFVCKKPRACAFPALRPHAAEEWHVEVVNATTSGTSEPPPYAWCDDSFQAYIKHERTGQYLCVDASNQIYLSHSRDPCWCLLTLVVHEETGAMVVLTRHGAAMFHDETGTSICFSPLPSTIDLSPSFHDHFHHTDSQKWESWDPNQPPPPEDRSKWGNNLFAVENIAVLYSSRPIRHLAKRYLRISIRARSRDLENPGLKECSVAVYDTSPRTVSYRCTRRPMAGNGADDLVYLEQEALLFFDSSTFAAPRVPLPNGRVRCENQSPTETATCTFAYGQGLTLSRQFRANWGYTIGDVITHRINVNPGQTALFRVLPPSKNTTAFRNKFDAKGGEWRKKFASKVHKPTPAPQVTDLTVSLTELAEFQNAFSVAYNNFYEILIVKSYVETRNWQLSVPVAPRSTDTIQFWLSSETLRYRWRALFAARGGFTISAFGCPIGNHHSLGDLTYFRDLFFFVFGTYEFPYEAEIIITVNDIPGSGWPLPLPEQSQGDRIRDVTRSGQLGFGYSPRYVP